LHLKFFYLFFSILGNFLYDLFLSKLFFLLNLVFLIDYHTQRFSFFRGRLFGTLTIDPLLFFLLLFAFDLGGEFCLFGDFNILRFDF